jgi:hypothetical protein
MITGRLENFMLSAVLHKDIVKTKIFVIFSFAIDVDNCELLLILIAKQELCVAYINFNVLFMVCFSVRGRTRTKTLMDYSGI